MITKGYDLDMTPGAVPTVVHLNQYEDNFELVFSLYTRVGTLEIESGSTASIRGTKADKTGYLEAATLSGTKVTVKGDKQITAAAGRSVFELTIYNSAGKETDTANFDVLVEPAALDQNTVPSATQILELTAEDILKNANNAASSATAAASSASAASTSEKNAASSATAAANSASAASSSQTAAKTSETNAASSASSASTSASNASKSASAAATSESNASKSASAASTSATNAATSETNASNSEKAAKAWAVGPSSTLTAGTDANNSKYWSEQAENTVEQRIKAYVGKSDGLLHYKYEIVEE